MGTKDEALTLRIDPKIKEQLKRIAKDEDRSLGWIVRNALEFYIASKGKKQ